MSITANYSGVVINQNATPTQAIALVPGDWYYQTFYLPSTYQYGSEPSQHKVPSLSGFQLLVKIPEGDAATAGLKYLFQYHIVSQAGWTTLEEGEVVGVHTAAEKVWMNIFFKNSIPIDIEQTNLQFRIGFNNLAGTPGKTVSHVWATEPNPVAGGRAFKVSEGFNYSYNFRVLAMTADSGEDFLGNQYRSLVVPSSLENTSTTDGFNPNAWVSSPQPSQFAVVSNYFDIRPQPTLRAISYVNEVRNPNFDYDKLNSPPLGWEVFEKGTPPIGSLKVEEGWSASGTQSLFMKSGAFTTKFNEWGIKIKIPISEAGTYFYKVVINIKKLPAGGFFRLGLQWFDATEKGLGGGFRFTTATGEQSFNMVGPITPAKKATSVQLEIKFGGESGVYESYIDNIYFGTAPEEIGYFDGDSPECEWSGKPGVSSSYKYLKQRVKSTSVIDGIFLDPQTPNVAFNVYWSTDGEASESTTTAEWENKLWTRVPETYIATQRQTYVFPEPIMASYVKIEYSFLQPKSYNAGDFQKPLSYKRFPSWVTGHFISELETPNFIANRVGVSFSALNFLYNYFLDDLKQEPGQPAVSALESPSSLSEFINTIQSANLVDPTTLNKINLLARNYTQPPGALGNENTLLGKAASKESLLVRNYPVEQVSSQKTSNLSSVSSLNREKIVFEQSLPVMYFYLTCRHGYKELTTTLEHNKAYFVAINEIAFIRNTYTKASDQPLFLETGGDGVNVDQNDFVINKDGSWTAY